MELPILSIAFALASTLPLGINTTDLQPSLLAAQAIPLPWFPSVAVTNTISFNFSFISLFCKSLKVVDL